MVCFSKLLKGLFFVIVVNDFHLNYPIYCNTSSGLIFLKVILFYFNPFHKQPKAALDLLFNLVRSVGPKFLLITIASSSLESAIDYGP